MAIYQTNKDCARILHFLGVQNIDQIDLDFNSEGFDQISHQWSYSLDQSTWSEFTTKDALLIELQGLQFANTNVYIRLRLEVGSTQSTQQFSSYELLSVTINTIEAIVDHMEMVNLSPILITTKSKNLFNPYRQSDQQKELYDKMAKSTNDIFGFECIYFRVEPVEESRDITFKTYNLHEIAEYKDLRVSIADNELPTDRTLFSALDIDFQDELEIHIVKEVFAEVFGAGLEPNSNDFLYLPLSDRMYQLNTKQNGDLFFNHSPYWRAFLVKYENRASIQKTDEQFSRIEELAEFEENYAKEDYEIEKSDTTKQYNNPKDDERQENISGAALVTDQGEVVRWMYNYLPRISKEVYSYDLNGLNQDQWSTMGWYKITPRTISIFELTDIAGDSFGTVHMDNGDIILTLTNGTVSIDLTPTQLDPNINLFEDQYIGIVINYSNTDDLKLSTISIFNHKVQLVAEMSDSAPPQLPTPDKLKMFGQTGWANLRVAGIFTPRGEMATKLQQFLPNESEYFLIDNATPDIEEAH